MDPVRIGQFIMKLRKKNNLTQKQFADKLNVTSQAVSKWENGRGIPDIETLKRISDIFNVEIKELLDGQELKERKKHYNFSPIILIVILILTIIVIITINFRSSSFNFSTLSSTNKDFNVTGVVAYSKDKKSIYISSINYNNNKIDDKYVVAECSLYEIHKNTEKKISQCGDITNYQSFESSNAQSLSYLLKDISFNVDDYSSMCKNLTSEDLYLVIKAIDINNRVINYKIPLTLNKKCTN